MSASRKAGWYLLFALPIFSMVSCKENPVTPTINDIPSVVTQPLSELLVDYTIYRPAAVVSLNDSILSAEITAPVQSIAIQVGDTVSLGEPLVELNCRDEKNRQEQAQAQLAADKASARLSQLDYQRAQQLYRQKNISKQALERRQSEHLRNQANRRSGQAALQLANANIDKCTIKAPFNGVLVERMATVGQLALPSTAMVRLVDTQDLEVSAYLTAKDIDTLRNSSNIAFSQNDIMYPLVLRRVIPVVDIQRRTQELRFVFTDNKPLPGSSGELVWTHSLPALPAEYLSLRSGKLGVLIAHQSENKTLADFYAIPNAQEGQPTPILMNTIISSTTSVLTEGRFGIDAGNEIEVVKP